MTRLIPAILAIVACRPDTHPTRDTPTDPPPTDTADTPPPVDSATQETASPHDTAPPVDPCDGLSVCDGFEGGAIDPTWEVVTPDCSGAGTLTVDASVAHGGASSIRVDGGGGYCDHVFLRNTTALPTGAFYLRFYVRFATALADHHTTFLSMPDTNDGGAALRMGGQSGIFMWNRASDDATLPTLSPAGIAKSASPTPEQWYCVEAAVDPAGTLQTWVDGAPVEGLQVDGTPTPDIDEAWLRKDWRPAPASFALGWESYSDAAMTLWFDDVALAAERIGCPG